MSLLDSPLVLASASRLPQSFDVQDLASDSSTTDDEAEYSATKPADAIRASPSIVSVVRSLASSLVGKSPPAAVTPSTPSASHLNVEDTLRRITGVLMRHLALGEEEAGVTESARQTVSYGAARATCPPSPQAAVHTAHLASPRKVGTREEKFTTECFPPNTGGLRTGMSVLAATAPLVPVGPARGPGSSTASSAQTRAVAPANRLGGSPGGIALRPLARPAPAPASPIPTRLCGGSAPAGSAGSSGDLQRQAGGDEGQEAAEGLTAAGVAADSPEAGAVGEYLAAVAADE